MITLQPLHVNTVVIPD